jgi:hypothetical protein
MHEPVKYSTTESGGVWIFFHFTVHTVCVHMAYCTTGPLSPLKQINKQTAKLFTFSPLRTVDGNAAT